MNASNSPTVPGEKPGLLPSPRGTRLASVDALRGLVVFTMIFVNDLSGVSNAIVPPWMKHFHGRNGMTFVDLVFPAFLFIVGMSLPLALGSRLRRGESLAKITRHVFLRTLALLFIGVLMVNETPDSRQMGWSGPLWVTLMYFSAILAFATISSKPIDGSSEPGAQASPWDAACKGLRWIGLVALILLALVFRGANGQRIISFSPFLIHHQWYGILGLIGWAYLVGAIVYLFCQANRTAQLGSFALLMCLYPAARNGMFEGLWIAKHVGFGEALGSLASITVAGVFFLTGITLQGSTGQRRTKFALQFVAGMAAAALLLHGLYGINKNQATPSWCLWACAITAALWLVLQTVGDVPGGERLLRPLTLAGQNVLLAYLISEMLPSTLQILHLAGLYEQFAGPHLWNALARSIGCAVGVLVVTAGLNGLGLRLKL